MRFLVMNTKHKLLLSILSLVLGAGFSGTIFKVFGTLETNATRSWFLEGNKTNQASIWGRYPDSWFGGTLAVGDVNGDGFDDLITNAPYVSEIVQAGGEIYVIPGPLAFKEVYTMPQRAALVFQGTAGDQPQVGVYLDSGDMNGDGIEDIVMGSGTSDRAHVYLGSSSIQASSPLTIAVSPENMALTISPAGDGLALCDFNADGYQDLFVEKFLFEGGVQVWGLLGSSTLTMTQPTTRTLPSDAHIIIKEFDPDMWHSPNQQNMACGDIDGDGHPDLAIGIHGESPSYRHAAGIVYVLRGDPDITSSSPVTLTMPDQANAIIEGVDGRIGTNGDSLGESLVSEDVNLDGRADLIMGAPGASGPDNLMQFAGEVYLWLGRALEGQRFVVSSQASWIVHGEKPFEWLGAAIATGDFDNDGYPEILLGCSGCAQGGPPFYLSGRGYVLEPLQITGQVTVTAVSQLDVIPYKDARCLGEAVTAMDLNGDSVSDLVMNAPCTDYPEGNLPGTVYVVSYPSHFRSFLPLIHK
jgi:hypothetical protein